MDEANDRMGLLMVIDDIGLLISTFGVLLTYYFLQGPTVITTNVFIICLFFTGIKILLTGIADITGIAKNLWVSVAFITAADLLIIFVNRWMSFGLSNIMLLITTVADVVMIIICLFIWRAIVGKDVLEEDERRRNWVMDESRDIPKQKKANPPSEATLFDEEEFESLFQNDFDSTKKENSSDATPLSNLPETVDEDEEEDIAKRMNQRLLEADDDAIFSTFNGLVLEEEAKPLEETGVHAFVFDELEPENAIAVEDKLSLLDTLDTQPVHSISVTSSLDEVITELPVEDRDGLGESFTETNPDENTLEEEILEDSSEDEQALSEETSEEIEDAFSNIEESAPDQVLDLTPKENKSIHTFSVHVEEPPVIVPAPLLPQETVELEVDAKDEETSGLSKEMTMQIEDEICKELDILYDRMKENADKTELISDRVNHFSKEIEEMPEITSTDDIVQSGKIIRSKLRTIIDKQFVMDDVLKDVVEKSEKINQRVTQLNEIETKIKEKEEELHLKETESETESLEEETISDRLFKEFIISFEEENSEDSIEAQSTENQDHPEDLSLQTGPVLSEGFVNPGEVLLENEEFSIIIPEEDLEIVRSYLAQNDL